LKNRIDLAHINIIPLSLLMSINSRYSWVLIC